MIDPAVVERNIARMAAYAKKHHLAVRPHAKTHKSLRMARLQMQAGAIGLTVAKTSEANVMIRACDDLLVAYPIVGGAGAMQIAKLARTTNRMLRVAVDSAQAVQDIANAAQSVGSIVGILVDLDVGFHRTGVQTPKAALELAQTVETTRGVRLDGLLCYPGQVTAPPGEQAPALAAIQETLGQTLDLWALHGLRARIVSGGSTPTAYQSHLVPALTEIRPGTYIYNDRNSVAMGCCRPEECAATILCTVVSDAASGKVVIDAGSKSLSSDRLTGGGDRTGYGLVVDFPQTTIVRLSEEHGEIDISRCDSSPRIGRRLRVIPNHICPCVNLQNLVYLLAPDGTVEPIQVDARGCTW